MCTPIIVWQFAEILHPSCLNYRTTPDRLTDANSHNVNLLTHLNSHKSNFSTFRTETFLPPLSHSTKHVTQDVVRLTDARKKLRQRVLNDSSSVFPISSVLLEQLEQAIDPGCVLIAPYESLEVLRYPEATCCCEERLGAEDCQVDMIAYGGEEEGIGSYTRPQGPQGRVAG
ncbi:hypothetical protein CEP54_010230 [Fusarium duplospermum]|uniref:Uncharacterized protein n=1 Tax=Fusarium duplospermum TaxID=1325734 RepID=A0A428PL31_9HYPO|nr:hypothetical protein CEP54_010230 [Fusarium duplospermum]